MSALPDTPSRARQELALRLPLGTAYLMSRGYAVPEVGEAYRRAFDLCQQLDNAPELIPTLFGLWRYYMARPDYRTARRLSEQLLGLARQTGDAAHLVLGHYALGSVFHLYGDPGATRSHMERGLAHYDPERHRSLAGQAGFDPAVTCRAVAAHALWELGFPDRARAECERANAAAETLAHPPSRAFALLWAALLAAFCGEPERTQNASERAIECCREHGIAAFLAMGQLLRGWARCERGAHRDGLAELEASLAALRNQGTELFWTTWMALRARALAEAGQVDAGLRAVAEGLAAAERNDERYWEAELYRLRGELGRIGNARDESEASLRKALALARASGARAWELRAATSLARLLAERGEEKAARAELAPLYDSFKEGLDTPDLSDARALLAGL